ncbi:hypothetical protein Pla52o_35230 [Novipirellula galeiformis]|uniref:Uncharacterized protein n=1 Tax=Novipirellula galeiformis TaxID=2528004 RepID=A0A5C6CFE6_9BACT|nr:hypothetical protein [Novipirellula galeiformis]TWU22467.1 hypothetical protein Pla52o_35230 [Novipirellula galeiformis]
MSLNNDQLAIVKDELTNDPTGLGLSTLAQDDEANANLLNEIRESIQVYRASVASNDFTVPVDEWNGLTDGQRSWLTHEMADGSVNPSVFAPEFNKLFSAQTAARVAFDAVAKESASRARELLGVYVHVTPSDVANARNA